jgi:hypothetical protein
MPEDPLLPCEIIAGRCCKEDPRGRSPIRDPRDLPPLKPYDFAMVRGKLLIVNPSDRKVAEVMPDVTGS